MYKRKRRKFLSVVIILGILISGLNITVGPTTTAKAAATVTKIGNVLPYGYDGAFRGKIGSLGDGTLIQCGGNSNGSSDTLGIKNCYIFNPDTGGWYRSGDFPVPFNDSKGFVNRIYSGDIYVAEPNKSSLATPDYGYPAGHGYYISNGGGVWDAGVNNYTGAAYCPIPGMNGSIGQLPDGTFLISGDSGGTWLRHNACGSTMPIGGTTPTWTNSGMGIAPLANGRVLLVGGMASNNYSCKAFSINPNNLLDYYEVAPMSLPSQCYQGIWGGWQYDTFLLPDGKVFVGGGTHPTRGYESAVYPNQYTAIYDPNTNSWADGPELPIGYVSTVRIFKSSKGRYLALDQNCLAYACTNPGIYAITFATPPNDPPITSPYNGQWFATTTPTIYWSYSNPSGGVQGAYQVQRSNDGWATVNYDTGGVSTTATYHTIGWSYQGTQWARVRVMEPGGLWSNWTYVYYYVDTVAPNSPGVTVSPASWTNGNVSVNMTHGAEGGSGVNRTQYYLSGATTTGWITYTGPITISKEGTTVIHATTIDNVGNVSVERTASAYIDKTSPALGPVKITSSNSNTAYAKDGDVVTLTFSANDTITSTPTVSIATHSVAVTNLGGNAFKATYTMTASDSEGVIPFSISNVIDKGGNAGAIVSTTTDSSYVRFDRTPPALPSLLMSSSNSDPTQARVGDIITLDFAASEPLKTLPDVTILGHTITASSVGGTSYRASYILTSSDVEGRITFLISNVIDIAGNTGATYNATTDGSSVGFSKTGPSVSVGSIISSNPDPTQAKPGDSITITFTSSVPLDGGEIVLVNGNPAVINYTGNGTYTAIYWVQNSDPAGAIAISLTNLKDTAGNSAPDINVATPITVSSNSPGVSVTTASVSSNNSSAVLAKAGNTVTVAFSTSKALGTNPTVSISGKNSTVTDLGSNNYKAVYTMTSGDTEGVIPFLISNVKDTSGNIGNNSAGSTDGSTVVFDKTPPTLTTVNFRASSGSPKVGDTLNLDFISSESLRGTPVVEICGQTVVVTSTGGNSYHASYVLTDTDTTADFLISGIYDLAGNHGQNVNTATNGGIIYSGSSAIIITISGADPGATYSGYAVSLFSASSTAGSITSVTATLNGQPYRSGTPIRAAGSYTLVVTASDDSGNTRAGTTTFNVVP